MTLRSPESRLLTGVYLWSLSVVDVRPSCFIAAFNSVLDVAIGLFYFALYFIDGAFGFEVRIVSGSANSLLGFALQFIYFAGNVFFFHLTSEIPGIEKRYIMAQPEPRGYRSAELTRC